MNDRERFSATMHFRPVDRSPIRDFGVGALRGASLGFAGLTVSDE